MTVFVDTSAFYAVFDRDDANHPAAKTAWTALLGEAATLLTNNYGCWKPPPYFSTGSASRPCAASTKV
jgi:hypothetical protein